jgi:hypothetical protein
VIKVSSGGHAFLRESLFSHVLEGVNPGVHHIIERHTSLHLAIGEDVVFPLALRDPFALGVIQREAVRPFRRLHKCWMRRRRISDVNGMYRWTIGRGGQKTDGKKGVH